MLRAYATTNPVGGDAHFDVPLSNLAVSAFDVQSVDFVGDALFPEVPVGKQSDKYYVISKDGFLRVPDTYRAPRTRARRVEFEISSNAYFAHNYALAAENAMEDLENADLAVNLRQNSSLLVVTGLRRDQEARLANLCTSVSNLGSGALLSGATAWSDGTSDPLGAINTAHAFIRQRTGLVPNVAVIDYDTTMILRRHPQLLDLYKFTSGGELTDAQLGQILKVPRVLVGKGVRENQLEGTAPGPAATSMTNIWGNNCLFAHVSPTPTGLQTQTFGLRFRWRNPIYPGEFGVQTKVENGAGERKVEVLEAGYFQDEKIVATDLAYLIGTTL